MAIDYARRPKTITLTASTRKAVEASYLASWVQKVEHTGRELLRPILAGTVLVEICIRHISLVI